jgi:Protein of unknown function (DUF2939)
VLGSTDAKGFERTVTGRLLKIFRRLIWLAAAVVLSYAASPLLAAVLLHTAIKQGIVSYIEPRVDWQGVRNSLKASITQRLAERSQNRPASTGMLQSIKYELTDYVSPYVIDYMIDQNVTAEGFVAYLGPKRKTPDSVLVARPVYGRPVVLSASAAMTNVHAQAAPSLPSADMLQRIKRAKFVSPVEFEIDVADRFDPEKSYRAVMRLHNYMWQLSRVEVLSLGRSAY